MEIQIKKGFDAIQNRNCTSPSVTGLYGHAAERKKHYGVMETLCLLWEPIPPTENKSDLRGL